MSRAAINFVLDAFMLLLFVGLLGATAIVQFIFPRATQAGGWRLWGYDYDFWNAISFGFLIVFAFSVLLHMVLHWSWVCGFTAMRMARRRGAGSAKMPDGVATLYGVSTLIGILLSLGAVLTVASVAVKPPRGAAATQPAPDARDSD
jgi:hypothetical protein